MIKVSKEILFHLWCSECTKSWDIMAKLPQTKNIYCPFCGEAHSSIEEVTRPAKVYVVIGSANGYYFYCSHDKVTSSYQTIEDYTFDFKSQAQKIRNDLAMQYPEVYYEIRYVDLNSVPSISDVKDMYKRYVDKNGEN